MRKQHEKRRHARTEVNKECRTHEWENGIDEYISDISNVGFKLHSHLIYKPGDIIGVTLLDSINKYGNHTYLIGNIIRKIFQRGKTIIYGVEILDAIDDE